MVTSLSLLRTMYDMCRTATASMGLRDLLSEPCLPDHLVHQLEILSCDSLTLAHRPCEVALALLTTYFQQQVSDKLDVSKTDTECGMNAVKVEDTERKPYLITDFFLMVHYSSSSSRTRRPRSRRNS